MRNLVIPYPDSLPVALSLTAGEFESEAKLALACKLYEMGRLSSGQAAAIAGVPRVSFLLIYYSRKSSRGAQIRSSSGVADKLLDAGIAGRAQGGGEEPAAVGE